MCAAMSHLSNGSKEYTHEIHLCTYLGEIEHSFTP